MKHIFPFILLFVFSSLSAQKKFKIDENGIVHQQNFLDLIKEREYSLVGAFIQIDKRSKQKLAKVVKTDKNGKFLYGYIDQRGNEVLKPIYTEIDTFTCFDDENGLCIVRAKAEKWQFYKASGENLFDFPYEIVRQFLHRKFAIIKENESLNYYLIDCKGKMVNKMPYESIGISGNSLNYIVKKDGRYGIIDDTERVIMATQYEKIFNLVHFNIASKNKKWAIFSDNGTQLSEFEFDHFDFHHKYAVGINEGGQKIFFSKKGLIIEFQEYQKVHFSEDVEFEEFIQIKSNDKWMVVHSDGDTILPPQFEGLRFLKDGYILFMEGMDEGVINLDGKVIFPANYREIEYRGNHCFSFLEKKEQPFGWDRTYHNLFDSLWIPPPGFKYRRNLGGGYFLFKNELRKKGVVDSMYQIIVPARYSEIVYSKKANIFYVRSTTGWGAINTNNQIVIECIYDHARLIGDYWILTKDKKTGIYDSKLKEVIPPCYYSVDLVSWNKKGQSFFGESLAIVADTAWGTINKKMEFVLLPIYGSLKSINGMPGYFQFSKKGEYGIIDYKGNEIVAPKCTKELSIKDGLIYSRTRDYYYRMDFYGNVVQGRKY